MNTNGINTFLNVVMKALVTFICFSLIFIHNAHSSENSECFELETSVTQKVEHDGYHRLYLQNNFHCRVVDKL